jgi:hypothetical protein
MRLWPAAELAPDGQESATLPSDRSARADPHRRPARRAAACGQGMAHMISCHQSRLARRAYDDAASRSPAAHRVTRRDRQGASGNGIGGRETPWISGPRGLHVVSRPLSLPAIPVGRSILRSLHPLLGRGEEAHVPRPDGINVDTKSIPHGVTDRAASVPDIPFREIPHTEWALPGETRARARACAIVNAVMLLRREPLPPEDRYRPESAMAV